MYLDVIPKLAARDILTFHVDISTHKGVNLTVNGWIATEPNFLLRHRVKYHLVSSVTRSRRCHERCPKAVINQCCVTWFLKIRAGYSISNIVDTLSFGEICALVSKTHCN